MINVTISIAVCVLLLYLISGYITVRITFRRKLKRKKHSGISFKMNTPASFRYDRDWLQSIHSEDVYIESADNIQLHGLLIKNGEDSPFVICYHGYKANLSSTAVFAHLFHTLGFSVLMADARAHGRSGGKYIGMGWPDRLDMLQWIQYLNRQFSDPSIILFGVSMGGTTVMNALGERLPKNVKCAIEDSGYVSTREVLEYQLKTRRLPPILIYAAAPYCKALCGFSCMRKDQTINQLKKSQTPILMIHGTSDSFVPIDQMRAASVIPENGKTVEFPDAEHADSIMRNALTYRDTISAFIKNLL